MKLLQFLLLACLIISCNTSYITKKQVHLDETGKLLSSEDFQARWRNPDIQYTRWDYMSDSARVATLSHPVYQRLEISYSSFRFNLEKITGKEIPENTIFLLDYTYLNDLCSSKSTNNWKKNVVKSRKEFLRPIKTEIENTYPEILYLKFFEEGITLQNDPTSTEEYFFMDFNNFLKNSLFRNPSFCGSFALVKPNGQVLIRNGESRADYIADHLKPEVWNQLFPETE